MISSSSDSCTQLVAGNYDVIVTNDSSAFKSVLTDFLERFEQHECELNQPDSGYSSEFKLLKEFSKALKEDKSNLEEGELEYNLRKNRYKDILPFSHTRVVLNGDPQIPGSEYINANYIRGPSGSPRAYIACQGPLQCTLVDFWRMIWECNVSVIIMACNENESGKPKCEPYWPEQVETSQRYGNIQVSLVKVRHICSDFLIRKFSVKLLQPKRAQSLQSNNTMTSGAPAPVAPNTNQAATTNTVINTNSNSITSNNSHMAEVKEHVTSTTINNNTYSHSNHHNHLLSQKLNDNISSNGITELANKFEYEVLMERTICQFHYTTWPDHGAPDSVHPILELVRLVRDVQPAEDRPILVHCSAGCGRTGTICCIDFVWGLLRRGKLDPSFDLCSIISEMRQQRMAMVQTLEQYILCHRAVAALFLNQLKLIDNHHYENLDLSDEADSMRAFMLEDQEDLGPVFI